MDTYVIGGERGTDVVAVVAVVISLLTLAWTMWSEINSYRRRQADEHWYREIFSPHCVEPVIELLNALLKSMREELNPSSSIDEYRECSDRYCRQKEAVLQRIWVAALFSDSFYEAAKTELDGVEDDLVKTFGAWSMKGVERTQHDADLLERAVIARVTAVLGKASKIDLRRFGKGSWRSRLTKWTASRNAEMG